MNKRIIAACAICSLLLAGSGALAASVKTVNIPESNTPRQAVFLSVSPQMALPEMEQSPMSADGEGYIPEMEMPAMPVEAPVEMPEIPQEPQMPEIPQEPQIPEIPQEPQMPEIPQEPQTPELPPEPPVELPETPQEPQPPEPPQEPQTPELPELPETPEPPPELEPEDPDIPPTGQTEPEDPDMPPPEPTDPEDPQDPDMPPSEQTEPEDPEDPDMPPSEPTDPEDPEDPSMPSSEPTDQEDPVLGETSEATTELSDMQILLAAMAGVTIDVDVSYTGDQLISGEQVTLTAIPQGLPEQLNIQYQWQNNKYGDFQDVEGAVGQSITLVAAAENTGCSWRVCAYADLP